MTTPRNTDGTGGSAIPRVATTATRRSHPDAGVKRRRPTRRARRAGIRAGDRRHTWDWDRGAEQGTGTVLTVVLVGALLILLPLALGVVTAVQANQRARAAADLGAIAAADRFIHGTDAAGSCARGAELVTRNKASPAGCAITADGKATVTARVSVDLPVLGRRTTAVSSRAGPILENPAP